MPSNKRASEVEGYGEQAEAAGMLEDGDNDGWVAPAPMTRGGAEAEEIPSLAEQTEHAHGSRAEAGHEAEEDIPDIDELELEDHDDEDDEVCLLAFQTVLQQRGLCFRSLAEFCRPAKFCLKVQQHASAGGAAPGKFQQRCGSPGAYRAHANVRSVDHLR